MSYILHFTQLRLPPHCSSSHGPGGPFTKCDKHYILISAQDITIPPNQDHLLLPYTCKSEDMKLPHDVYLAGGLVHYHALGKRIKTSS